MNATSPNTTAPVTIDVRFAPAAAFSVRVRAGAVRQTSRARVIKVSAAPCGNAPADGGPSTGWNAPTKE